MPEVQPQRPCDTRVEHGFAQLDTYQSGYGFRPHNYLRARIPSVIITDKEESAGWE